jgi:hypothetical protein
MQKLDYYFKVVCSQLFYTRLSLVKVITSPLYTHITYISEKSSLNKLIENTKFLMRNNIFFVVIHYNIIELTKAK